MRTRKRIRLLNYDYCSQAWYFITICTHNREHDFGEINKGKMNLSPIGKQANIYIKEIPKHFPNSEIGEFVIMPNHIHILVGIAVGTYHGVSAINNNGVHDSDKYEMPDINNKGVFENKKDTSDKQDPQTNQFGKTISQSISAIIGQFKSTLTRWCRANGFGYFVWQKRFYDHVVRNQMDFDRIENYICSNIEKWKEDSLFK